ncbi:hypothetical protein JI742_07600 [Piscinibacter sp. Jin2]|uniref:Uncharacterized protein n=1 Tax=Aquariibacter lacus TaxID=2801332 RepID=A0A9X0XDX0_9BURK|nr:hypothetical protein [Piscinibacter lacus]MBL0719751.1 hypothetical protein [Piscinibacter lacus]
MMFLFNGIRAEVEPVPKKKGWYQLTGKHIERWTMDVSDTLGDLRGSGIKVDFQAKVMGIHDREPEIALHDPRFNEENNPEHGATFGVYTAAGRTYMLMAVNQAEYVIFRFLCPHEAGDDGEFDPISEYRIDVPASKAKRPKKVAA